MLQKVMNMPRTEKRIAFSRISRIHALSRIVTHSCFTPFCGSRAFMKEDDAPVIMLSRDSAAQLPELRRDHPG